MSLATAIKWQKIEGAEQPSIFVCPDCGYKFKHGNTNITDGSGSFGI